MLSSGVIQGAIAQGSARSHIVDPARCSDPPDFWVGYQLRLLDSQGQAVSAATVAAFDAPRGLFQLSEPLASEPRPGSTYELSSEAEAPLLAIRYLLGLRLDQAIPPISVRLGTTRGTNALITRRGARTALVTTRGFGDILHIGYQNRPRLFELAIQKPQPLFVAVVEIDERIDAQGHVLLAPQPARVRDQLSALKQQGIESLAICLLHAFVLGDHEELVAGAAREVGFEEISVSSRIAPLVKIVSRGDTTVMDAYLNPILRRYVRSLRNELPESSLRILTSAGGLVEADEFIGKDSILSGPAGGVVGFSRVARSAGFERAIGFDMGGTSTDVSRFEGRYELEFETEKSGVRVVAPMMAIETVAAGGGSICRFDGVKLVAGPDSAGADPGPACYGRGGPLTITDVNFFLGKILPDRFPFPLDRSAVEARIQSLVEEIAAASGRRYEPPELAEGFVRVTDANMAKAIGSISVAKGCDPRQYVLVPFGGAAGQHACAVARELGIGQILHHPDAGLLSAYGIGLADVERHGVAGVYQTFSAHALAELESVFERLEQEALLGVAAEGITRARIVLSRWLELRYRGVEASLMVPCPTGQSAEICAEAFLAEHRKLYGYVHAGRELEIVAARVDARGQSSPPLPRSERVETRPAASSRVTNTYFGGRLRETRVFDRQQLRPGDQFAGPAIVCESSSTTVIEPDWQAEVLSQGELLVSETDSRPPATSVSTVADPVMLEIFNNQFAAIAEQMGITLRNTSSSVNVKERLDFSCALFTPTGDLVVNAPHIPVHLGAMAETVRRVIADNPLINPGDVFVTNDPYRGGSHLPDVTVITPVHGDAGRILFFTASRAHHAELGGIRPGSMPPFSRNLAEEGVLVRNFKLIDAGKPCWDELRAILLAGPNPTRGVDTNLADIAAQVAANHKGAGDVGRLVERYSLEVVEAYMRHIQMAAEQKVRQALRRLKPGRYPFVDHLDDGTPVAVTVTISGDSATIDFRGTGPVNAGNLNANRAITTAAVMYVLRCLLAEDIPLNQGVLAPVEIIIPRGLLNPPEQARAEDCAAVVGGNVETSQRVVDVLLGALGMAAASQGTMNNLLFGDPTFGYYETICGGAGATSQYDGADAVHTHMTNTRLTDPEVLERRYPVRVRSFSIRGGSGGTGRKRGGDGVVRRLEFLQPLEVSILSQRRGPYPPYGLAGGAPGALGRNTLHRADGTLEHLGGRAQFQAQRGDVLVIETPGGGGYGRPASERSVVAQNQKRFS
ncbi:MAG: hydantoinase B/oxoprolinase family protein, partial [Planctomycetia bacterium]|nr:hydantoinase B/oxoprolinase family protein [Planctomycetia bacterium]